MCYGVEVVLVTHEIQYCCSIKENFLCLIGRSDFSIITCKLSEGDGLVYV